MASPRERDHRGEISRQLALTSASRPGRHHHFHDVPPWPHQHHHDYVHVDSRWGWWPRWYPYSDPGWYRYWWQLYDYYGGDASPAYAEYARDAILRQRAPELGLVVSGYGGAQIGRYIQPSQSTHYQHPHYTHGDYVTVHGSWWPRWFPYWDPSWCKYWWQLYHYYGGDAHREYAEHARDALLRSQMSQLGAR